MLRDQPTVLQVAAASVLAALPFAAVSDVRYFLNAVHVEPADGGGVFIAATDGRVLFVVRDSDGFTPRPMLLPLTLREHRGVLKTAYTVRVAEDGCVFLANRKGEPVYISTRGEVEGKFPDWRALIHAPSAYSEGLSRAHDVRFLQRVIRCDGMVSARFYTPPGERDATLFTLGTTAFGLIMPIHDVQPDLAQLLPEKGLVAAAEA